MVRNSVKRPIFWHRHYLDTKSQPRIHHSMPYLGKAPPKVVPRVVLKEEGEGEGEEEEKNVFQP